ncbi:MAG: ABC transporter ATP-binding protein [Ferruginibacter sp.]
MDVLQVEGISKIIRGNFVVKQISFTQQQGQKIAIAGETGSGKSSLLKMIAGLLQPDEGEILFQQKRVEGPNEQLIAGHPSIGYLSQYFELRNNYKVYELLEMFNRLSEEEAAHIYQICDITYFLQSWTNELSGGEKQRIALAKILVAKPSLLLLDEPFSNMDTIHKSQLKKVIHDITAQLQLSCMMVSHDAADLLSWADYMYLMKAGVFIQQGSPSQLYNHPLNAYCAALLGDFNLLTTNISFAPQLLQYFPGKSLWMIRLEQILINKPGIINFEGTITAIYFMGAFSLLHVQVGGTMLQVKTNHHQVKLTQTIRLSIDPIAIHPLH